MVGTRTTLKTVIVTSKRDGRAALNKLIFKPCPRHNIVVGNTIGVDN